MQLEKKDWILDNVMKVAFYTVVTNNWWYEVPLLQFIWTKTIDCARHVNELFVKKESKSVKTSGAIFCDISAAWVVADCIFGNLDTCVYVFTEIENWNHEFSGDFLPFRSFSGECFGSVKRLLEQRLNQSDEEIWGMD
jgi:hypothetical protein